MSGQLMTLVMKVVMLNDTDFMETIMVYQYKTIQTCDAGTELAQSVQVLQVFYGYKCLKFLMFFGF